MTRPLLLDLTSTVLILVALGAVVCRWWMA